MEMESTINMRTNSTNNNAVDLLTITEAAVKALAKPRFNRTVDVRCVDYMGTVELDPKHSQVHVYPNLAGEDSGAMDLSHSGGYALHSQNVNASARSSDSDRSSILADSAFLTGTAKPVKISTKRLTEIKSPFDEPIVMQHNRDDGVLINYANTNPKTTEYPAEKSRDLYKQVDGQIDIKCVDDKLADSTVENAKTMPMLDSGYMTQHVTVMKEGQHQMLRTSDADEGGWTAADQQVDNTLSSVEDFLISPQATGAGAHLGHQVDILTAPECIQSDESSFMKDTSPSPRHVDVAMQHRNQTLVNRFAKYQPGCALRQGTLMEGSHPCPLPTQTTQGNDVHISQFSLSSRDRALKQALVKRMHKDVAVKKVVQPILVQSQPPVRGVRPPGEGEGETRDSVASAAAVAAVSAVMATQPLMKAQQDMEHKMTQLLEKLMTLPQQSTQACQLTEHTTQQETIAKLEEKLTRLTNHRLSHLEKMQLIQFQAQLALRNKKAGSLMKTHAESELKRLPRSTQSADEIYRQTSPKRDVYTTDMGVVETSMLNTPAPRAKPPMPTSFRASQSAKTSPTSTRTTKKVGGLLEEILAHQEVTPHSSPFPDTPSSTPLRGRPVLHSRTVNGFTETDVRPYRNTTPTDRQCNTTRLSMKYEGQVALSPYPSLRDIPVCPPSGSAPYAEAKHVLQGVHMTRTNLEANLATVLRSHCVLPGYEVAPPGIAGSEHQQAIEKMVDERINAMNAGIQREALNELIRGKDSDILDMIPERDVSAKRTVTQAKVKVTSKFAARPGLRAGSKVASRMTEKENIPQKKVKQTSTRQPSATASVAYLTHVYGKPAYQNQRTTMRGPYLKFQSAPKTMTPVHLPVSPVLVEGVEVATHRTQTDHCWPTPATDQFYFDPVVSLTKKRDAAFGSPVRGQLVAMAVPLAAPRKEGSRHPTVHPSSDIVTSTPVIGGHKVGVRFQEEMEQTERISQKYPDLSEQVLSPVPVDTGVVGEPDVTSTHQLPGMTVAPEEREEEEEETFVEEEGAAPLSVPGSKVRCPPYHGPHFPPSGTTLGRQTARDRDSTALKERDLLQRQAVCWIEQELMARVISEMHYVTHDDTVTQHHDVTQDVTEVTEDSRTPADSFIVETMGEAGLQLFLDAGCVVDNNVVNSLIKEVLLEKITSMAGEQTSHDSTQYHGSHDRHVTSYEEAGSEVAPSEASRVPTPLPTPKLTPAASRSHSPSRPTHIPTPVLPTAGRAPHTPPVGSGPPPTSFGSPVAPGVKSSVVTVAKPVVEPAAAPVAVSLSEPAAAPVAVSLSEPAAAVRRQLEQAAAMVLTNTQTMLTHAAAALVSGQLAAPASGQLAAPASGQPIAPVGPSASDLEKAVALVLSTAKEAGTGARARQGRQEEGSEEEEEEEGGVKVVEENLWRPQGLTTVLGTTEEEKDESEEFLVSRHDVSTPSLTPRASPAQFTPIIPTGAVSELVQVPDDLSARERGVSPRASPQPWGNPHSPGPELDPNYGTEDQEKRERWETERPMVVFPVPAQPSSPAVAVSQSVDTGSASSEDTSYSVTDFVSEGQWLISQRSEGEVLHHPLPPELNERAPEKAGGGQRQRERLGRQSSMTDDTLGDTDDFLQEDVADMSRSEGECLLQRAGQSPPHEFVTRVASLRQSMMVQQASLNQAGLPTNLSLGEVVTSQPSLGQVTEQRDMSHATLQGGGGGSSHPRRGSSQSQIPSTYQHAVQVQRVESSPQQSHTTPQSRPSFGSRPSLGQVMATDHHRGSRPRFKPSSSVELSDEWRTLTPDQINVDALLQSNDYFGMTQMDLGSMTNPTDRPPTHSAGDLRHQDMDAVVKTSSSWQGQNLAEVTSSMRLSVTIPSMTEDYSSITDSVSEITASPP